MEAQQSIINKRKSTSIFQFQLSFKQFSLLATFDSLICVPSCFFWCIHILGVVFFRLCKLLRFAIGLGQNRGDNFFINRFELNLRLGTLSIILVLTSKSFKLVLEGLALKEKIQQESSLISGSLLANLQFSSSNHSLVNLWWQVLIRDHRASFNVIFITFRDLLDCI